MPMLSQKGNFLVHFNGGAEPTAYQEVELIVGEGGVLAIAKLTKDARVEIINHTQWKRVTQTETFLDLHADDFKKEQARHAAR